MSVLNKVVWAEGVFLGQQHFQAWDRFQSDRLQFVQKSLSPFFWGLLSLQWNESALREGRFELVKLECILQDGRVIDFRRDQDAPVFMDLNAVGRDEFTVHVAVPNSHMVEGVAGYQASGRVAGWLAQYHDLADESDSSRTREVMLAKPNVMLKTDSDLDQMSCLRLARIQRQYDGEFKVVPEIIPASLTINAVPAMRDMAQSCLDMLTKIVREFSKNRAAIGDISSYSASEMSNFLFQKELVLLLPELASGCQHGRMHPYSLYLLLGRLHQVCAVFLAPENISRVPDYDHQSAESSIPVLLAEIRSMLAVNRDRPEDKVEFKAVSPGRFESTQIPRHALENYSFYLAVDAKQDSVDWVARFTQMCKLASPDQLETVVASGLPGVSMRHVQRLPQKIRIKSGFEYFQISTDSKLWDNVIQTQKFGVFCLGEFADSDIELIILEEK
ncbi:type VI secretion system baseplate subunit TssK [Reinekea marinisedimentorum]|uniref:Type VI secretion system protein ImpJ n=1 Tax=Reinekea marinisedimentorum TaxID=230495 RepID=A0A4R3I5X3_9GAMM|nr:type VI secretion system baseplate subunit TssK [Reinekea marinisedimentorum]TCS41289.1 type VI secretion system protein ImpJ [Reinekea marinisedimentorum]